MEESHSGLVSLLGKQVCFNRHRGFESLLFRLRYAVAASYGGQSPQVERREGEICEALFTQGF